MYSKQCHQLGNIFVWQRKNSLESQDLDHISYCRLAISFSLTWKMAENWHLTIQCSRPFTDIEKACTQILEQQLLSILKA